jgi:RNA polymerase sigma factor (sigma-70 family)
MSCAVSSLGSTRALGRSCAPLQSRRTGAATRAVDGAPMDAPPSQLVARARRRDERAWAELVSRYAGLVWSVARAHRLGEADAADVAQATWMSLLEHIDDVREPAAVGGWIATTARRECLRVLRCGERVVVSAEVPEQAADAAELDAALLTSERDRALWTALRRLGARDQALLRMLAAEPAPSYEEIGAALGMPIGSIGPTRARALARLRCQLDAQA